MVGENPYIVGIFLVLKICSMLSKHGLRRQKMKEEKVKKKNRREEMQNKGNAN